MKMKECTECLVQERVKKQSRIYTGAPPEWCVRGESVGEDCNVNCLGLKATENAAWDLQSKRELVYVSVCV